MKRHLIIECDVEDSRFRADNTLEEYIRDMILPAKWGSDETPYGTNFSNIKFSFTRIIK